ncbi:MAG TPA: adenylate/guanylate cyclase domain-containing protein [Terriglobales bacterium]|nr:adenylate/guanylate cyclase domain-containing protein [Terriglobales bacterium]
MPRLRLRWKILLYASSLLVALLAAMLVFVNWQADRFVNQRLATDLDQGRKRVQQASAERFDRLDYLARNLASYPDLKALLDTRDLPTIRDFLDTQRAANSLDLLLALDSAGKVLARTDSADPAALAEAPAWTADLLAGRPARGFLAIDGRVYQATAVPASAGSTLFGFLVAGVAVDDAWARRLAELSGADVVLASSDRVLGSSLSQSRTAWKTRAEWEQRVTATQTRLELAGEAFSAIAAPLESTGPLAVVLKSRSEALAPYRGIQLGLIALGLVVALVGIVGSAVLARSVTAPIARLEHGTSEVAAGNFDFRLDLPPGDEIGSLAASFNHMTEGLRERRDLQKFVSRSAMERVRSNVGHELTRGERLQLTIFFSDMRGFTTLSEHKQPEEVVAMLNSCLSLQAEKVKKFSGDIDKYVGDCVVAIFSGQDMALNAIRCALEIHKAVADWNAANPARDPLQVGVGIVTGEVVLGSIGSADRQDFTVIGSNVNLCSRLCAKAAAGEVLLAESTYKLVQDLVAAERLEPMEVKGFSRPVEVYRMRITARAHNA